MPDSDLSPAIARELATLRERLLVLPEPEGAAVSPDTVFSVVWQMAERHRAVHEAIIGLAARHLANTGFGRPPVAFSFMMLGSGARGEQSVMSDQDHALVYAAGQGDPAVDDAYFSRLGEVTSALLHKAGYALCTGNVMAGNPRWRGTAADFKARLAGYAAYPDWDNIRFLLIATDAAPITGPEQSVTDIRRFGADLVADSPFIKWKIGDQVQFARLAMSPLGGIRFEPAGPHKGTFAIKEGLYQPLVNVVRLFALGAGVEGPSTEKRIQGLAQRGVFERNFADEVRRALAVALTVRVRHHVALHARGAPVDDYVPEAELDDVLRQGIRQALRVTRQVQQLAGRRFPRSG